MRRKRESCDVTFTLTGPGRGMGPIHISGQEFDELARRVKPGRRQKVGPLTRGQSETLDLFREFVGRGLKRATKPREDRCPKGEK